MDTLLRDIALAVRLLRRRAGFSALAITVMALAIGANSAIFSVVEGVLLRPPAFEDPDRLVFLWEERPARNQLRNVVGPYSFVRWRERTRTMSDMAAFIGSDVNLTGRGEAERVDVGIVTGNLFAVLGVKPLLGRTLEDADSRPGAARVAVLSEGYWKRRFGSDPAMVGTSVTLNAEPTTVVGVVRESFQVPPGRAVWIPLPITQELREARGRWMTVVGRLRPEATLAQAHDEMVRLAAEIERERPQSNTGWTAAARPLHADMVRDVRPALMVLIAAVGLLLLVSCANVANLLLARAIAREREVAIRAALGASSFRLVRQLLTESVLLALAGGVAGLLLGAWLVQALRALLPAEVRLVSDVGLSPSVLAFTTALSLASAVLFGLAPALQQARPALAGSLKEGGQIRGASQSHRRLRRALVVSEVALALVLTAGTGILLRSFWKLANVDPGFRAEGVLSAAVDLPPATYATPERSVAFFRDAVERISRLPGVSSAGAMSWIPLGGGSATRFWLLDRPAPPPGQESSASVLIITPGLLRTLGMPVLSGRDFDQRDTAGRPGAVIVNRAFAAQHFAGRDPIGTRLRMSWSGDPTAEIVAVVGDARLNALDRDPRPTLFWPHAQLAANSMNLMVRATDQPEALAAAVRTEVSRLDPDVPPGQFRTLEEVVAGSLERQRLLLRLLAAFACLALVLAVVGVYGVMSYTVLERVPEVGVRVAVGASPGDIVRLILREGLALGLAGVAAGLLLAAAGAGALRTLLYQVPERDPWSLAAVSLLLLLSIAAAAWLPARRAARVDPIKALRAE